jgi:hypothetical protein
MSELSPQDNIEMAERELGLDENYPYEPGCTPDYAAAQAHALLAIAGHLSRIAESLDMHNTIAINR